jgi:hypothetical protein
LHIYELQYPPVHDQQEVVRSMITLVYYRQR